MRLEYDVPCRPRATWRWWRGVPKPCLFRVVWMYMGISLVACFTMPAAGQLVPGWREGRASMLWSAGEYIVPGALAIFAMLAFCARVWPVGGSPLRTTLVGTLAIQMVHVAWFSLGLLAGPYGDDRLDALAPVFFWVFIWVVLVAGQWLLDRSLIKAIGTAAVGATVDVLSWILLAALLFLFWGH
jgi:hypothetical protein